MVISHTLKLLTINFAVKIREWYCDSIFQFCFYISCLSDSAKILLFFLEKLIIVECFFWWTIPPSFCFKVFGSITGVRFIIAAFPNIGRGPVLSIDIHRGALTEGILTFAIVSISLGLSRRSRASTFMKTWISSLSKLTLHILGSDLTGGCMNPASVSTSLCKFMFYKVKFLYGHDIYWVK